MQADLTRSNAVDLLWQLKQRLDQLKRTNKHGNLPYVHFNMLLKDSAYRDEMLARAGELDDVRVREILGQLGQMELKGELVARPDKTQAGTSQRGARLLNPDVVETRLHMREKEAFFKRNRQWVLALAGILLTAGMFGWVLNSDTRKISGTIGQDTVWHADTVYLLDGEVFVENNAVLTIEPGTLIKGMPGSALIVTRGSQLRAVGRADAPIIFTSARAQGQRKAGDWGGLVLLGAAPVNQPDPVIEGVDESDPRGHFGGDQPEGSCGVMEYMRVEFAGFEVYADNELNGITFGGCGSRTIVRHVQVHRTLDDGIEVFGGRVSFRNILITGPGDDGFDWDMGWTGNVQFLIVQQYADRGDNAFEGDSSQLDPDAVPRSEPTFYNVTLISARSKNKAQRAMVVRRGSGGHFHNMIIEGFSRELVDLRDSVYGLTRSGALTFSDLQVAAIGKGGDEWFSKETGRDDDDGGFDEAAWFKQAQRHVTFSSQPALEKAWLEPLHPDFRPDIGRVVLSGGADIPQGEFWDESANYLGAIKPAAATLWYEGWSAFPES